jgi:hypothetical protein
MNFEQFQNQSRLYVIGALERKNSRSSRSAEEIRKKAEDFISKCYALHEAFALSLRPAKVFRRNQGRLMAMVKAKKQS